MYKKDKLLFLICAIVGVVFIRLLSFKIEGIDFLGPLSRWYQFIIASGGFSSIGLTVGDYSPPYMYLLTLGTYITKNCLLWIKSVAFVFDLLLAYGVYLIANHYKSKYRVELFLLVLFIPGVIINSAILGQCDSVYTSFVVLFFYNILRNRPKLALSLLGIALGFKLQAIFVFPVILYLIITKKIKWYDPAFCLIGFLLIMTPAMIYGISLSQILGTYYSHTSMYPEITRSSPNIYSLFFLNYRNINLLTKYLLGIFGILVSLFIVLRNTKRNNYSDNEFLNKVLLLTLVIPFILPGMMDRYFYMANIFIVIFYYLVVKNRFNDKQIDYKELKLYTYLLVMSFIAYLLPVFSINFLPQPFQTFLPEFIFVSIISAPINAFIVFVFTKKLLFLK